ELIAAGCVPGGSLDNLTEAKHFAEWDEVSDAHQVLLTDAQTSGGLLFSVAAKHVDAVLARLARLNTTCAAVIGRVVKGAPRIRISI
ncbi:MAG: AIR synthase-related protein, partial [Vicinamibacterales bacterium]